MLEFEIIHTFWDGKIERAKVPGGWLVTLFGARGHEHERSITFVPDPYHDWNEKSSIPVTEVPLATGSL